MSQAGPERDGHPLVGRGFLVLFAVISLGVAAALHPDVLGLRSWLYEDRADAVAASYLQLELAENPGDRRLREAFVRQLMAAGRLDEASEVAGPLAEAPFEAGGFELVVELELERVRAAEGEVRKARSKALQRRLRRAEELALGSEAYLALSGVAHELGDPSLAARFLDRAIELETQERMRRTARLYDEAAMSSLAADRWLAFARLELERGARAEPLAHAVAALVAAGRLEGAREVVDAWLLRRPDERAALDAGIQLAWSHDELELAFELSQRRIRNAPMDPAALDDHVALALARGRPREALDAARRLMARLPGSRRAAVQRARVAEWSGQPHEALAIWWDRAQAGDAEALVEAERLAEGLGARAIQLALVRRKVRAGQVDPATIRALVYLAEAEGRPEEARDALESAVGRPDATKATWLELARLEHRMGLVEASGLTWDAAAARYPLDEAEVLERAEVLWRARGPRAALAAALETEQPSTDIAHFVGELAFRLGERELAHRAFEQLRGADALQAHETLQALRLLASGGDAGLALDYARYGLRRGHGVEVLLRGLEIALDADRPDEARALLGVDRPTERQARARGTYWRLRARLARMQGQVLAARRALERVLELDPGSEQVRIDLVWLMIELNDRAGLRRWLERFGRAALRTDEAPFDLLRALAAGEVHLGRPSRALVWFARLAGDQPEDWRFWLEYALVLEQVGRADAALRLRRYGLRMVPDTEPEGTLLLGPGVLSSGRMLEASRRLARAPGRSPEVRKAAIAYLLEQGELDRAGVELSAGSEGPGWTDLQLLYAVGTGDEGRISDWLRAHAGTSSPELEMEAWARVGRFDRALERALVARQRGGSVRATLESLVEPGLEGRHVEAWVQARRLGQLSGLEAGAEVSAALGTLQIAALAGAAWNDDEVGRQLGAERSSAARLGVRALRRWRSGFVSLQAGLHAQPEHRSIPQVMLAAAEQLDRRFRLLVALEMGAVVDETATLSTLAARDRLRVEAQLGLGQRFSLGLEVAAEHHVDRARHRIGLGGTASARLAYAVIEQGDFRGSLFVSGTGSVREASALPLPLRESAGLRPEDVLPEQFLGVGGGVRVEQSELRSGWFAEAWLGGQWPLDGLAYRLEAGFRTPIMGADRLSVAASFGNLVAGGPSEQGQVGVSYRLLLP